MCGTLNLDYQIPSLSKIESSSSNYSLKYYTQNSTNTRQLNGASGQKSLTVRRIFDITLGTGGNGGENGD